MFRPRSALSASLLVGEDEKLAAEKEESNSKSAYQTLFQKLTDTITRDKSTVKKKTTTKAPGVTTPPNFPPSESPAL